MLNVCIKMGECVNRFHQTHSSTAVFQQNVDVVFVFKVMIEVDDVFMMECFVEFDFFVNLKGSREHQMKTDG